MYLSLTVFYTCTKKHNITSVIQIYYLKVTYLLGKYFRNI